MIMRSKILNTEQKLVFLRAYEDLCQLEQAMKIIGESGTSNLQVSVVGKFDYGHLKDRKDFLNHEKKSKKYWKKLLGTSEDIGVVINPEWGAIFIVGPLTSIFLHKVGKKTLGSMSVGPYSILRGFGIEEKKAITHLKNLEKGNYLLFVRGYGNELTILEDELRKLDKVG